MEVIAIIPARGGSTRLPKKNLLPLAGKPLVAHSIEQARASQSISRTIVTTDNDEIAAVARGFGSEVVRRPENLAGDAATSESALAHALETLKETEGYVPELVVFLQCTSPIRCATDIDRAVQMLSLQKADSLLSVCRTHTFLWRRGLSSVESVNFDYRNRRRTQDMPEEFVENGSIYVFKPWVLEKCNNRLGGTIALYEMGFWTAWQIDTQDDFDLCEWIMKRYQTLGSAAQ
jgi:N-acylneuraminate cytidylyltransferase